MTIGAALRTRTLLLIQAHEPCMKAEQEEEKKQDHRDAGDADEPDRAFVQPRNFSACFAAHSIAYRIGRESATPRPAMSNAVPWSTEQRR